MTTKKSSRVRKQCLGWTSSGPNGPQRCKRRAYGERNYCSFHAPCRPEHLIRGEPIRHYLLLPQPGEVKH